MTNYPFEWLPLDNAGKVFPPTNIKNWANVYRFTIQLKENIDPVFLRKALDTTLKRIPTFKVRIRDGFFWNYYEINCLDCPINHDIKNFCYRINFKENNGYLFRIYYHNCRISIDIFHALCDGYSGAVFLSTLAGEYLRLKGNSISHSDFVLDVNEEPSKEELEDAYIRYAADDSKADLVETRVYHKKGTKLPPFHTNYTSVIMSFEQLHAVSKSYNVTVTEFLATVLLYVHYRIKQAESKSRKPVSVQIPLNLRKAFPSRTLRNFVLNLNVKTDNKKKDYTFEEMLETVKEQLRKANNKRSLNAYITRTVRLGTQTIKLVPLSLKNFFIGMGFRFGAEYSTTTLISNLGAILLPEDMKEHVERFFFFTGPGLVNGARCGVVSYGDSLVLTFSNCYEECDVEKAFLAKLTEFGITVTVETNRSTDFSVIDSVTIGDTSAFSDEAFIPTKNDRKSRLKSPDISFAERLKRTFHI